VPITREEISGIAVSNGEAPSEGMGLRRPDQRSSKGVGKLLGPRLHAGWFSGLRGETGASAVEMALVAPVLVLLMAGLIDFGLVFNDLMSLRQGLGAGIRQGGVAQPGSVTACSLSGAGTATTETKKLMCLTKSTVGLGQANTRTKVVFPGSKLKGGSLIVCAQTPLNSATTVFNPILNGALKAKVQMRIEQDLSAYGNASETALANSDWSWCA
jgi:hypothetical protein